MKAIAIPTKFPVPFGVNATTGFIRAIPETTVDPNAASLDLGFPPNTATPVGAGGVPPNVADVNGILNEATAWLQWAQAGGILGYDAAFSAAIGGYPRGACLLSATLGNFWFSTVDDNTSNPDAAGAGWISIQIATPPIGSSRSLSGNAPGGTKTASWSAIEFIVESALGGTGYKGVNLSLSFNGAGTGANGMDTGAVPTSTDLSVYAIFNPVSGTWATLGTIACNGQVYTGANIPSGYTASALLWSGKTDGSANVAAFLQQDRWIYVAGVQYTAPLGALTAVSIATAVPANALAIGGRLHANTSNITTVVSPTASGVGSVLTFSTGGAISVPFGNLPCSAAQTVYASSAQGGLGASDFTVNSYRI